MLKYINLEKTPFGSICIVESDKGLKYIKIGKPNKKWIKCKSKILLETRKWLGSYFKGSKEPIPGVNLDEDDTDFRLGVWKALRTIPYGSTLTYSDIAIKVNNPMACRAIGQANKRNPLIIFTPCHRVIGKNSLGGYSSGGLKNKRILLNIEKAL